MRRFDSMNPIATAIYYLCVLCVTMFAMTPAISCISLVTAIITCTVTKSAGRREHIFSAALFVIAALINPLFVHNGVTVLLYLNDRPITLEATLYGVNAATMLSAALYWLRALSKAMTSDKVLYLTGRISPKLSLILSMALRYIGLFKQQWRRIQDAQRALGLYDDGNLIDAVRGRARVLGILITKTLENGIITAESMEARGYGTRRRTCYAAYRVHGRDIVLMAVSAALTAATVTGICRAETVYYPQLSITLGGPYGIAGISAFAVLCLIPLIIETKEAVRWHCLISAN